MWINFVYKLYQLLLSNHNSYAWSAFMKMWEFRNSLLYTFWMIFQHAEIVGTKDLPVDEGDDRRDWDCRIVDLMTDELNSDFENHLFTCADDRELFSNPSKSEIEFVASRDNLDDISFYWFNWRWSKMFYIRWLQFDCPIHRGPIRSSTVPWISHIEVLNRWLFCSAAICRQCALYLLVFLHHVWIIHPITVYFLLHIPKPSILQLDKNRNPLHLFVPHGTKKSHIISYSIMISKFGRASNLVTQTLSCYAKNLIITFIFTKFCYFWG